MARSLGRALAAVTLVSVFGGCGGIEPASETGSPASRTIGGYGLRIELPAGWHGDVKSNPHAAPLLRAATFPLDEPPSDVGRRWQRTMGADDVLITIADYGKVPGANETGSAAFPVRVGRSDVTSFVGFREPVATQTITVNGRTLQIWVVTATTPTDRQLERANAVLATLEVSATAAGGVLSRNGISLAVPHGWDGRLLFRDPAGSSGVVFQVANFELPPNEGFEPPQELPPGQEDPIKAMDDGDVLVTVISDEADGEPAPKTIALDDLRVLPTDAPRVPRGHALAEGAFCYGERCLRVEVDFGEKAPPLPLRDQVNALLASLVVKQDPRRSEVGSEDDGPRGCPRANWPGPWTACSEADWVRRVVEGGGYRVEDETGSALVGAGKGRSFYIWSTRAQRPPAAIAAEAGNWHRLAVVDGVPVYGDEQLWRFWEAQGFVFWVKEGPQEDSVVPSPDELAPLIAASRTVPPPPAQATVGSSG